MLPEYRPCIFAICASCIHCDREDYSGLILRTVKKEIVEGWIVVVQNLLGNAKYAIIRANPE
jgi:hypothetical protein